MKKLTLLTVVLLTFGLVGLGAQMMDETSGLSFEIDGEATSTIGYDLNSPGDFGFSNSSDSEISITLVTEATSMGSGMDIHGVLELEDYEIVIDEGGLSVTPGDVTATIYADPVYIIIFGANGMDSDQVAHVEDDEDGDYDAEDDEDGLDLETDLNHDGGLTIGVDTGTIDIALLIASESDHTDGGAGGQDVSVGAIGTIEAGPATVTFDIVHNLDNDPATPADSTGVGAKVSLDIESGGVAIAPYGGIDVNLAGGTTTTEFGAGADVTLNDELELGVAAIISDSVGTDVKVTLDTGDMLPVGLTATLGLFDLDAGALSDMLVLVGLDYAMDLASGGTATTAVDVDVNIVDGGTPVIGLAISETIDGLFENVEFVLTWDSSDVSNDNGTITFDTTVSY